MVCLPLPSILKNMPLPAVSSPFSYSCNPTPRDIEDQTEAALGSSQALSSAHGTHYKVGKLCESLYPAPGNVLDWMYVRESVKYAYVVHLRDTGTVRDGLYYYENRKADISLLNSMAFRCQRNGSGQRAKRRIGW